MTKAKCQARVHIAVTYKTRKELKAIAEKKNINLNKLLIDIINSYLNQENNND